jgi:hypothetical protein
MTTDIAIPQTFSIDDPTLENLHFPESCLNLFVSDGKLHYAIYDKLTNRFVSLHTMTIADDKGYTEMLDLMARRSIFSARYAKVKIMVEEDIFSLIPKDLFLAGEVNNYLPATGSADLSVRADQLLVADAYNVYNTDKKLVNQLRSMFMDPLIWCRSSVLINAFVKETRHRKEDCMLVLTEDGKLDIIALEKGRFVFYNRFPISTPDDLSYFTLAVTEQLNFNTDTLLVTVSGAEAATYLPYAKKYFRNVEQGMRPQAFQYSALMDSLPLGAFYELFSLNACE